ncbi:MAG: DUF421 domain-containing protein [Methanocella sp.]
MGETSFFAGHETLTAAQWALRGAVAYLFLLLGARIAGQRAISQLRLLDFTTALILGNILAHPLSDPKLSLLGPLITTFVVVALHAAGALLSLKSPLYRRFVEPPPVILVRDGQVSPRALRKARLPLEGFLAELRKLKVADLGKVALALWEPGGTISVFLQPAFEPATRSDLAVTSQPFSLPRTIIREGRTDGRALGELGKEEAWLQNQVKAQGLTVRDVFLATLADGDQLHVVAYPPPAGKRQEAPPPPSK